MNVTAEYVDNFNMEKESDASKTATANNLRACDVMTAARLFGLNVDQAHKLVNMCSNKVTNSKTSPKSSGRAKKRKRPSRWDDARSRDGQTREGAIDKEKGEVSEIRGQSDVRSSGGCASSDAKCVSGNGSSSSDESPTEWKSTEKQLDATLKRIKYLEEQQQLQDHQLRMMEYALLMKRKNEPVTTSNIEPPTKCVKIEEVSSSTCYQHPVPSSSPIESVQQIETAHYATAQCYEQPSATIQGSLTGMQQQWNPILQQPTGPCLQSQQTIETVTSPVPDVWCHNQQLGVVRQAHLMNNQPMPNGPNHQSGLDNNSWASMTREPQSWISQYGQSQATPSLQPPPLSPQPPSLPLFSPILVPPPPLVHPDVLRTTPPPAFTLQSVPFQAHIIETRPPCSPMQGLPDVAGSYLTNHAGMDQQTYQQQLQPPPCPLLSPQPLLPPLVPPVPPLVELLPLPPPATSPPRSHLPPPPSEFTSADQLFQRSQRSMIRLQKGEGTSASQSLENSSARECAKLNVESTDGISTNFKRKAVTKGNKSPEVEGAKEKLISQDNRTDNQQNSSSISKLQCPTREDCKDENSSNRNTSCTLPIQTAATIVGKEQLHYLTIKETELKADVAQELVTDESKLSCSTNVHLQHGKTESKETNTTCKTKEDSIPHQAEGTAQGSQGTSNLSTKVVQENTTLLLSPLESKCEAASECRKDTLKESHKPSEEDKDESMECDRLDDREKRHISQHHNDSSEEGNAEKAPLERIYLSSEPQQEPSALLNRLQFESTPEGVVEHGATAGQIEKVTTGRLEKMVQKKPPTLPKDTQAKTAVLTQNVKMVKCDDIERNDQVKAKSDIQEETESKEVSGPELVNDIKMEQEQNEVAVKQETNSTVNIKCEKGKMQGSSEGEDTNDCESSDEEAGTLVSNKIEDSERRWTDAGTFDNITIEWNKEENISKNRGTLPKGSVSEEGAENQVKESNCTEAGDSDTIKMEQNKEENDYEYKCPLPKGSMLEEDTDNPMKEHCTEADTSVSIKIEQEENHPKHRFTKGSVSDEEDAENQVKERSCMDIGNRNYGETILKEKVPHSATHLIWMVGDFVLEMARSRARLLNKGHLGFKSIEWHTNPKARMGQFLNYLKRCLKEIHGPQPSFILIHLGANDLLHVDVKEFGQKVAKIIKSLAKYLPHCHIVWSSMVLHCLIHFQDRMRKIDRARRQLNKVAREQLKACKMVHFISYDHVFKRNARILYQTDGLSFSQQGVDMFLVVLQSGLSAFMKSPEWNYFP